MAKRYLLCVDDTLWSLHALSSLKMFIKQDRKLDLPVALYVLHVSQPPVTALYRTVLSEKSQKKLEDHSEVAGTKILSYYYSCLEDLLELGVELMMLRSIGKTVDMINRAVEQYHIDEIVMGKGGSTFLQKTFLGSITKAVMESCDCPTVLIVKKPPPSWGMKGHEQVTEETLKARIEEEKIGKRIYTEEMISDLFPFARYCAVSQGKGEGGKPAHPEKIAERRDLPKEQPHPIKQTHQFQQQQPMKHEIPIGDSGKSAGLSAEQAKNINKESVV